MHRYLVIDGMFRGTGIRDKYEGGYINPDSLNLSFNLVARLTAWLKEYEEEYYNGYINRDLINTLDIEGIEIAKLIQREIPNSKIEYFSDSTLKTVLI